MCVVSVCSLWADYVHIEEPDHIAHSVDRVASLFCVICLSYGTQVIVGLSLAYCAWSLALGLMLFGQSRCSKTRGAWVLWHTLWHVVPQGLLLLPDVLGSS